VSENIIEQSVNITKYGTCDRKSHRTHKVLTS